MIDHHAEQKRQYFGITLASNVGPTMGDPSGSSGSRRSEGYASGSPSGSRGSSGGDQTSTDEFEPPDEPPANRQEHASDQHEPPEPPTNPIVNPTCAVPACTRAPRRSCWTCADHMTREHEFTDAA